MEESEASILSMLQPSTESTGIHRLFTEHLHPFTPFTAAKKQCKPLLPAIRPLAKRFASFICNSISLIPKRLSESPKISQNSALELLESYRLCLDCFEVIAPELTGVPHKVQVQRIRYIHSLEHWDLFKEAEDEGFVVLESLNAISKEGLISKGGLKGKPRKQKGRLVPQLKEGDRKLAFSVLEVVVTLVKCAMKRRSKMEADYWRVISLVNESEPCFKILDAKDYEKLHHFLETNLHIIAAFLVSEMKSFSVDLILEFSAVALKEYEKSSSHTQMYNVAVKICSTCFYQRNKLSSDTILEVLIHVLDFLASVCKDGADTNFLDLVCYCADKCQHATFILCDPFGKYLYTTSDFFHEKDMFLISSILRLYASGLLAHSSNQLKGEDSEKGRHSLQVYSKERLQQVALSVNWLNEYYNIAGKEKSSCEGISQLPYWKALKFFCLSLAESIYSRKEIFLEAENGSCWEDLSGIHDAFHQFCRVFLNCLSATEKRKETSGDNHRVISVVVVAALMLSFKTNQFIKESAQLVTQIISAEWVPIKRLKFIHVALQNISLILNKDRYQKQAINSLEMCLENFNGTESSGSRVPHPPETIQQEGGSRMSSIPPVSRPPETEGGSRMSSIPPVSRPPETEGGSRMSSIPPVSRPPETEGGSIMSMNLPLSRPSETASASAPQMTRRRVIRWTREEEQTLENGYELICGPPGGLIPWTDILKFGEGFLVASDKMEDQPDVCSRRRPPMFRNIDQLKGHLFHKHKLYMCSLCLEGRKRWMELKVKEVASQDIQNVNSATYHFMGTIQDSTSAEYFQNYDDLEIHFRQDHFLCEDDSCLAKKFIIYQSKVELKGLCLVCGVVLLFRYRSVFSIVEVLNKRIDVEEDVSSAFFRDFVDSDISLVIQASAAPSSSQIRTDHGNLAGVESLIPPLESISTIESDPPSRS